MLLLALPGAALHRLLLPVERTSAALLLCRGFALSFALIGALGLVFSVLHLSARALQAACFAVGAALLLLHAIRRPLFRPSLLRPDRLTWLPLLAALALASRLALCPPLGGDDYSHLARIQYFLSAARLGFEETMLGSGHLAPPRYWFAFWPLAKALLAARSGLDPRELVAFGLAPLLAPLALLSFFTLARRLSLSPRAAAFATLAQAASLLMIPQRDQGGGVFFGRIAEDKVAAAFFLAPVFLGMVADGLRAPRRGRLLLLAFCGFALGFAHPVLLGLTGALALFYVLLHLALERARTPALLVLAVLTLPVLAFASLRFVELPLAHRLFTIGAMRDAGELDPRRMGRLLVEAGSVLPAASPSLYLEVPFGVLLLASLLALPRLRAGAVPRLLAAASALLIAAAIPQTGWALGLAITPFMLWRTFWLAPFGIAFAFLAQRFGEHLARAPHAALLAAAQGALLAAGFVRAASLPLPSLTLSADWRHVVHNRLADGSTQTCHARFEDLRQVGGHLDARPGATLVAGDHGTNGFIPSLSSKARVFVFRAAEHTLLNGGFAPEEVERRVADWRGLMSPRTRLAERERIAREWHLQFLLVCGENDWAERWAAEPTSSLREEQRSGPLRLFRVGAAP